MNNVFKNVTALTLCALSIATSNVQALNKRASSDAGRCVTNVVDRPWMANEIYTNFFRYGKSYFAKSELNSPVKKLIDKLVSMKIQDQNKYNRQPVLKALREFLAELKTLPVGKAKIKGTVLVPEKYKVELYNQLLERYNKKVGSLTSGKQGLPKLTPNRNPTQKNKDFKKNSRSSRKPGKKKSFKEWWYGKPKKK